MHRNLSGERLEMDLQHVFFFFSQNVKMRGRSTNSQMSSLYPQTDVVLKKEAILKAPLLKSQTPTSFLVVALTLA